MNKIAISIIGVGVILGASPFILNKTTLGAGQTIFHSNLSVIDNQSNNKSVGLNADPELQFGQMPEGVNITKRLNLSSDQLASVSIDVKGNISEYLSYTDTYYFEGRQEIPIEVRAQEAGYYEGDVVVKTYTPKNGVGERWLNLKSWLYSLELF